jgi:serine/threonine protein kinase
MLGSGAFAQVRKCIHKETGAKYAMKIIDKKKFMAINSSGRLDNLMDEVNILRAADHTNIIRMFDVIETPKTLYVVLELVSGGDLFDRIVAQEGKGFSEEVARYMFEQMLAAVKYLHSRSIVHRDLKVRPRAVQLRRADALHGFRRMNVPNATLPLRGSRESCVVASVLLRVCRTAREHPHVSIHSSSSCTGRCRFSFSSLTAVAPASVLCLCRVAPESNDIRVSDFGLSRMLGPTSFMKTMCGTPQYLAPEILIENSGGNAAPKGYDKAVDLCQWRSRLSRCAIWPADARGLRLGLLCLRWLLTVVCCFVCLFSVCRDRGVGLHFVHFVVRLGSLLMSRRRPGRPASFDSRGEVFFPCAAMDARVAICEGSGAPLVDGQPGQPVHRRTDGIAPMDQPGGA